MKPYIAILIDSFWEAVGSKVLWALLVCWSILLAGLAPFGYITERSFDLSSRDIRNRAGVAEKLVKALEKQGTPAQQAVAVKLEPEFKATLAKSAKSTKPDERFRVSGRELAKQLNAILRAKDLYSAEAFPTAADRERLKPLLKGPTEQLSDEDLQLLNRQLLQIAFSADLRTPRNEQLWIGYAGFKLTDPLPITREQARSFVETYALGLIIKLGLSVVAVFIGIIVTSSMIPETFRAGSLHLLLSKPISRPLLYLSKFLGGTLFMLANITYFLTGLYFVVGMRLDIWNIGLLLCIPLLMFVFMIFYSVSALIGLIWNNAIISVVACLIFWVFCFTIGTARNVLRPQAELVPQNVRFAEVDSRVLAITQAGALNTWNDQYSVWQPAVDLERNPSGRVLGPLVAPDGHRFLMRSDFRDPFGNFGTSSRNFVVVNLKEETDADVQQVSNANQPSEDATDNATDDKKNKGQTDPNNPATAIALTASSSAKSVDEARRKPLWMGEVGPEPPPLMIDLVRFGDTGLAVTRNGFFLLEWSALDANQAAESSGFADALKGVVGDFFKQAMPRLQVFRPVTPPGYEFADVVAVAADAERREIVVYNGGTIDLLSFDEKQQKLVVKHTKKLEGEPNVLALIAMSESAVAVAREKLGIEILSRDLSTGLHSVSLSDDQAVRQFRARPESDTFSVVFHSGEWSSIDAKSGSMGPVSSRWGKNIAGVTWLDEGRVWVGVKPDRAVLWNAATDNVERTLTPAMSRLSFVYHWIANPLYTVSPKPAALDDAMTYLLSGTKNESTELMKSDMEGGSLERDIWQPIISNMIFVTVMLALGCIWVVRKQY